MSGQTPDIADVREITSTRKTDRLEARLSRQQKALIERAAAYEGRSVSDFVINSAQKAAEKVVGQHEVWELNGAQSRAFVEALLRPKKPNKRLLDAVNEHRETVEIR